MIPHGTEAVKLLGSGRLTRYVGMVGGRMPLVRLGAVTRLRPARSVPPTGPSA